jgi:hypothetical protein
VRVVVEYISPDSGNTENKGIVLGKKKQKNSLSAVV